MIKIGNPRYESEFSLTLNGFESDEIQSHARLDIIFVLSGTVHVETAHKRFDMKADDFCVFNVMELYRISRDENSYILRYSISEYFLGKQYIKFDCTSVDLRFGDEVYEHIRYHLARIFQFYYKNSEHNRAIIYSHIYTLLDMLIKYFSVAGDEDEGISKRYESLEQILKYILQNYNQRIQLDDLASRFYLSSGYISRLFQQQMHMTFSSYLRIVRLSNAYNQLCSTDKSITSIAMDTGFGSTTQLIEAFKQRYGITPGKLRKVSEQEKDPEMTVNASIFETLLCHATDFSVPVVNAKPLERIHYRVENPREGKRFKPGFFKLINVGFAKEMLYVPIQEQLRMCQQQIGFEYIRFHGMFDEDMMVYHLDKNGRPVYNFNYVDMVYDFILSIGLKPYVEFSYYPLALASDLQTDFQKKSYTRGLPNSMEKWCELVKRTLRHWIRRYGLQTVRSWWFRTGEAHNIYFRHISFEDYMYFYTQTCLAVKEVDPELQFGGLNLDIGILHGDDVEELDDYMIYLRKAGCLPDLYSFQCFHNVYTFDFKKELEDRKYHVAEPTVLSEDENYLSNRMSKVRKRIKAFDPRNKNIILDSWNSNIWQRDLRNDTCFKAAFLFKNMLENAENIGAFGYWLASDLYEEVYGSKQLFHGGYGLITSNGIPKAAYNAFRILKELGNRFVQRGDGYYVTCSSDGSVQIALYNYCHYDTLSCQQIFVEGNDHNRYEVFQNNVTREYSIELALPDGKYSVKRHGISRQYGCGSAYDTWLSMGSPEDMSASDIEHLKRMAVPSLRIYTQEASDGLVISETLEPHEVCVLTIKPCA